MWIQMRLRSPRCERKRAYVTVRDLASELLAASAVRNFCFLHEPPGLRIRFEVTDERRAGTQATIDRRLDGWDTSAGVYTPDDAASLYCDRLSTLDALAWLDFHLLTERGRGWLFALAVQRELFPSLGVAGGQERRVWTRLRERPRTGPGRLRPGPSAATVRRLWSAPEDLRAGLPRPAATLVDAWAPQLVAAGRAWHDGLLGRRATAVGPCEGAVHVALLSWNRGRVHPVTQARVASALAEPEDRS